MCVYVNYSYKPFSKYNLEQKREAYVIIKVLIVLAVENNITIIHYVNIHMRLIRLCYVFIKCAVAHLSEIFAGLNFLFGAKTC